MKGLVITELHAEIYELIKTKQAPKHDIAKLTKLSTITKQPSRVRLAIDDMERVHAFERAEIMENQKEGVSLTKFLRGLSYDKNITADAIAKSDLHQVLPMYWVDHLAKHSEFAELVTDLYTINFIWRNLVDKAGSVEVD